jgi:hypothetical protein
METGVGAPRVFISYSHDSDEHVEAVLDFSNRLRSDGVDARIDRYEQFPPQGWPRWMQQQVEEANFVLLVCTATYRNRVEGREEKAATWEGLVILQLLYGRTMSNCKFVPLLFGETKADAIPLVLQTYQRFRIPAQYDALYRLLTSQPELPPPPLAELRRLEVVSRGLPPSEGLLNDPDLSGTWRHRGLVGYAQRLNLKKVKPLEYSFEEYFWGAKSGSGNAYLDQEDWLHVKGVNTLAGSYTGRLRLVEESLVGEVEGSRIPRLLQAVRFDRLK